jgi:hypothetical protein
MQNDPSFLPNGQDYHEYSQWLTQAQEPSAPRRKHTSRRESRKTRDKLSRYAASRMQEAPPSPSTEDAFFTFQQRYGKLNMREISRVDIDKVVQDLDIPTIQRHIENIAFCDLKEGDLHKYSDQNFVKLFKLCQLTVEYLLNVQNKLAAQSTQLLADKHTLKHEFGGAQSEVEKQDAELEMLRREMQQKQKSLHIYESLLGKLPGGQGLVGSREKESKEARRALRGAERERRHEEKRARSAQRKKERALHPRREREQAKCSVSGEGCITIYVALPNGEAVTLVDVQPHLAADKLYDACLNSYPLPAGQQLVLSHKSRELHRASTVHEACIPHEATIFATVVSVEDTLNPLAAGIATADNVFEALMRGQATPAYEEEAEEEKEVDEADQLLLEKIEQLQAQVSAIVEKQHEQMTTMDGIKTDSPSISAKLSSSRDIVPVENVLSSAAGELENDQEYDDQVQQELKEQTHRREVERAEARRRSDEQEAELAKAMLLEQEGVAKKLLEDLAVRDQELRQQQEQLSAQARDMANKDRELAVLKQRLSKEQREQRKAELLQAKTKEQAASAKERETAVDHITEQLGEVKAQQKGGKHQQQQLKEKLEEQKKAAKQQEKAKQLQQEEEKAKQLQQEEEKAKQLQQQEKAKQLQQQEEKAKQLQQEEIAKQLQQEEEEKALKETAEEEAKKQAEEKSKEEVGTAAKEAAVEAYAKAEAENKLKQQTKIDPALQPFEDRPQVKAVHAHDKDVAVDKKEALQESYGANSNQGVKTLESTLAASRGLREGQAEKVEELKEQLDHHVRIDCVFEELDKGKSGTLSKEELESAYFNHKNDKDTKMHKRLQNEFENLVMETGKTPPPQWQEPAAPGQPAILVESAQEQQKHDRLNEIFEQLNDDGDGDGVITKAEFEHFFNFERSAEAKAEPIGGQKEANKVEQEEQQHSASSDEDEPDSSEEDVQDRVLSDDEVSGLPQGLKLRARRVEGLKKDSNVSVHFSVVDAKGKPVKKMTRQTGRQKVQGDQKAVFDEKREQIEPFKCGSTQQRDEHILRVEIKKKQKVTGTSKLVGKQEMKLSELLRAVGTAKELSDFKGPNQQALAQKLMLQYDWPETPETSLDATVGRAEEEEQKEEEDEESETSDEGRMAEKARKKKAVESLRPLEEEAEEKSKNKDGDGAQPTLEAGREEQQQLSPSRRKQSSRGGSSESAMLSRIEACTGDVASTAAVLKAVYSKPDVLTERLLSRTPPRFSFTHKIVCELTGEVPKAGETRSSGPLGERTAQLQFLMRKMKTISTQLGDVNIGDPAKILDESTAANRFLSLLALAAEKMGTTSSPAKAPKSSAKGAERTQGSSRRRSRTAEMEQEEREDTDAVADEIASRADHYEASVGEPKRKSKLDGAPVFDSVQIANEITALEGSRR